MRNTFSSLVCITALMFFLPLMGMAPAVSAAQPLPADINTAWENAGAIPGWMGIQAGVWVRQATGQSGEVPAFRFNQWSPGVIPQLPQPQERFGLDLTKTEITDFGLEELSGFTWQLRILDLANTQVSDAGLPELAVLNHLESLDLEHTQVTNLNGLAGFTQLQTLYLGSTRVTDTGLKELTPLRQLQTLDLDNTYVTDAGLEQLAGRYPNTGVKPRRHRDHRCGSWAVGRS
jgi:internalin A